MFCRIFGVAPVHTPPCAVTSNVFVTADAIADIAIPSTCEMIELTTFRNCRSSAAPAYAFRAISSSVSRTFWPHF
jgi:hypothetical protein